MRKIGRYILLIVLFVFSISGCSGKSEIPDVQIPTKFESNFNASFGSLEISGNITKSETGIYNFLITSPKTLEGMELSCIGDKITTKMGEANFETDIENLLPLSFVKSVITSLDTISKSGCVTATRADGYNRYSASSQTDEFYLLQEQSSGNIVSLVIEHADISMNFVEFKSK